MNTVNTYENLYSNMKNRFTVSNDNCEYTLGEYMLMKAGAKKEKSNLPAASANTSNKAAIAAFFKYVNDKLTVKKPPVKDKTIKSFPFRTSLAALLSAIVACTLVFSYGSVTMKGATNTMPTTVDVVTETDNDSQVKEIYTSKK